MLKLTREGLGKRSAWQQANIACPNYDLVATEENTRKNPVWLHFGAGNIFRGFIAPLQDKLLNDGLADSGIIAVESYDYDIISKIYAPHDNLSLLVTLRADGSMSNSVVASIACSYTTDVTNNDMQALVGFFSNPSLQMVSFTITEKGYAVRALDGNFSPLIKADIAAGPQKAVHVMSVLTALLLARYQAGKLPISLVSMDNCSHNGDKLKQAVLDIANAWQAAGFADAGFIAYLLDPQSVAYPWTMIDKITPRPAESVMLNLKKLGIADMAPIQTDKGTFIAPFVNAEAPEYLVVEDSFPNGRPPLEKSGVYFTDRQTVDSVERMKVTTCLNPLHTALAIFGCLLGYESISSEMADEQLAKLVDLIGYTEGLPVVTHPGIIDPKAFIDEVIGERLPNPFIPDTPQRIATDTSQKVAVRFGETMKAYAAHTTLKVDSLVGIPLALAGWLRYLLAVDDQLQPMAVSSDPLLAELQAALSGINVSSPESVGDKLKPVLSNSALFGVDLYAVGLAGRVETYFCEMLAGKGAVRATLTAHLK